MDRICKHCGGEISIRNPTGNCDHLYWPDLLTDDAKRANGYAKIAIEAWRRVEDVASKETEPDLVLSGQDLW